MVLSRNLLHFRKKCDLTRQQAAAALCIPPEVLRSWETGDAQPEAAMLPRIAGLYAVTIDDLFARHATGFENQAQRLAGVFDTSHDPADFALADEAFRQRWEENALTEQDLLEYASLQQTMMELCMEQALSIYEHLEAKPALDDLPAARLAKRRHMHLLVMLGRHTPALEAYIQELTQCSSDPEEWLALIAAFQDAQHSQEALQWLHLAQSRFPNEPTLCYWGGIICQSLKRWQDALSCWEQALRLDPDFTDAAFAQAECYERLGDLRTAQGLWHSLARKLEARGCTTYAAYPKEQARRCAALLGKACS